MIAESSEQNTVEVSYSMESTDEISISNSSSGITQYSDSLEKKVDNNSTAEDIEEKEFDEIIEN